ncbi:IclR family transcriptional regulator [Gudongella oleilytica]|uniref:IclR family transcriptional regulator n=1 Tax=Gudongella oleilytica TaxID=1582259 RepID=UPI000FF87B6A|nr:IclR family transcriptional regulator [Gudongella oleilytica]
MDYGKIPKYPVQTVEKALEIIELLTGNQYIDGVSISELSKELDLGKSTVHRIIETMEAKGYIHQDNDTKKYHLSWKLFELGNSIPRRRNLFTMDTTLLQALCDKFQETVNMGVRVDDSVVTIHKINPTSSLIANLQIGTREALHATAMGKALMSQMTREEIVKLLGTGPYEQFTSKTIKDVDQLTENINMIRKQGYSLDDEEYSAGLTCISVPLKNYRNEIVAAVSISGATIRMTEEKLNEIQKELKHVAERLSAYLGWQEEDGR